MLIKSIINSFTKPLKPQSVGRAWLAIILATLLSACGGGGSGGTNNSGGNASVSPAPQQPSGGISYADADSLLSYITRVEIPEDGRAIVDFQLTNNNYIAITDLTANDIRLVIAKLQSSAIGGLTGSWQSYINTIEEPTDGVGPETAPKMQASSERGSSGELTNNQDGSYRYRFAASVLGPNDDNITDQAETEGLDLSYQPQRSHRVAIQFDNSSAKANPIYDWLPATGAVDNLLHYNVVATENCNSCHGELAFHGGGRIETRYCVTCHNPGSTDANSGNSIDFKVMIHKIHRGAELPSVLAGGEYAIWGFNDSKHDYSKVKYPRDIKDCKICHAGTATGTDEQTLTPQGDNWSQYATAQACGSCHDDLDFSEHFGGQPDNNNCMSCHATDGVAGSIDSRHNNAAASQRGQFEAHILAVRNTAPGQFPQVDFEVINPEEDNAPYDILTDPAWTTSGASLSIRLAWSTTDYTNAGNNDDSNANSVSINALATASANGDGSFQVVSSIAIPDGSITPNIPATGSGATVVEGRAIGNDGSRVPLTNVVEFYSIDEVDGTAVPRRQIVALDNCLGCHGTLSLHGGNRTDNIDSCVSCHNPRNTDIARRPTANPPPTDGKNEESVDFKTMIHGIHAGGFREDPLQIVGFGGTVHTFAEKYPADLNNCLGCHEGTSYTLPMASQVLATTHDTGPEVQDPSDDTVTTRGAAVCSSCHDSAGAQSHMEANGGNFATTQAEIDAGIVIEQCEVCHAEGKVYSVSSRHGL